MQHGVVVHLVDTRNRADITGYTNLSFLVLGAIDLEQLATSDQMRQEEDFF